MTELNSDLKKVAICWAEKVVQDIYTSFNNPEFRIDGENLQIYKELKEWRWFDICKLDDPKDEEITLTMLAMRKYGKLKWKKEHPPKNKPSKWEVVTGRKPKK